MSNRRTLFIVAGAVLAVATVCGVALYAWLQCTLSMCPEPNSRPFVSPRADWGRVSRGFHELKLGMTTEETVATLGEPDDRQPLYTPDKTTGRRVGSTLFYFQYPELGLRGEGGGEEHVRVYVDLHGRVRRVWAYLGRNEYENGERATNWK